MRLANKYRPQDFYQVVGQENAKSLLSQMFLEDKEKVQDFHAILLHGASGTGKTTLARIIAKKLEALYIEIDASTNTGIDDIRAMQNTIARKPVGNDNLVIVLDECHMLSTNAFNSLLKTLEEPPSYAYIILCTTEYEKIPTTIAHRCLQIPMKKLSEQELSILVDRVAQEERIKIDERDIKLIASNSEGSARNSLNLLEEYNITGTINVVNDKDIMSLVSNLQKFNTEEVMKIIDNLLKNGITAISVINKINNMLADLVMLTRGNKHLLALFEKTLDIQVKVSQERFFTDDYFRNAMLSLMEKENV